MASEMIFDKQKYMNIAINSLAVVKQDIIDNQFDITQLEVTDYDGEALVVSVHQDWELSAKKKEQKFSGQHSAEIDCATKTEYTSTIDHYFDSVNAKLPYELLADFQGSEAFCQCQDYTIDDTTIAFTDKCSPCRGTGEVSCSKCGGSGRVEVHVSDKVTTRRDSNGYEHEISRIPQYESRTCGRCNGSGRETCKPCEGTGYITKITTVTRFAKLFQTYALEPGHYSEKTVAEIMNIPTDELDQIALWNIGRSTAQHNHFQVQYVSQIDVTRFCTRIAENTYEFLSLNHPEINSPRVFNKSPILDEVLIVPLQVAQQVTAKSNQEVGKKFLGYFPKYKFLHKIMLELAANPDYSKKHISLLVSNNVKGYLSLEKTKQLVGGISKSYRACLPTHSKLAIVTATLWLLFIYEILSIPILPLARKSLSLDSFYVVCAVFVICFLLSTLFSRWVIRRKYKQIPEGVPIPKPKNLKVSFIFSLIFAGIGFFTISVHEQIFTKYYGSSLLTKFYPDAASSNNNELSAIQANKPPAKSHAKKH